MVTETTTASEMQYGDAWLETENTQDDPGCDVVAVKVQPKIKWTCCLSGAIYPSRLLRSEFLTFGDSELFSSHWTTSADPTEPRGASGLTPTKSSRTKKQNKVNIDGAELKRSLASRPLFWLGERKELLHESAHNKARLNYTWMYFLALWATRVEF